MTRTFTDKPATRERVPMLVGLVGPSGSGKTYSALRLATGMQRVTGGDIYYIDTESRRALHYADDFTFQHIDMGAPFSSLDYMAAIEHCKGKGAGNSEGVLVIDSMSHEHEGPGGYLEYHDSELDRMAGQDYKKREKATFTAWIKPSADRRKLINAILRMGINAVFCFRAKEKIKIITGKNPLHLGWQPIAGSEFTSEMVINCLLYPAAGGVPNWAPDERAEDIMLKRPDKLKHVFKDGKPLSEDTGEALAKWAEGDGKPTPEKDGDGSPDDLAAAQEEFAACLTAQDIEDVRTKWGTTHTWTEAEKGKLKGAVAFARERLDGDGEG